MYLAIHFGNSPIPRCDSGWWLDLDRFGKATQQIFDSHHGMGILSEYTWIFPVRIENVFQNFTQARNNPFADFFFPTDLPDPSYFQPLIKKTCKKLQCKLPLQGFFTGSDTAVVGKEIWYQSSVEI